MNGNKNNERQARNYWALANYIGSELIERELKINPTLFDSGSIHSVMSNDGRVTFHKTEATKRCKRT